MTRLRLGECVGSAARRALLARTGVRADASVVVGVDSAADGLHLVCDAGAPDGAPEAIAAGAAAPWGWARPGHLGLYLAPEVARRTRVALAVAEGERCEVRALRAGSV
ncbi:hypothetical protein H3146_10245 [Streptomyces sp. OF3]|uniref:Uncharacterized protein n=1 Tax=Streptomyces alkaliterrae TaxID=2213162 RepID=A0A7W3WKB1_9ACTN|nr:hypothetical protein [Streptomyces alkaliterrae]MBB1253745.1 hypothetical protein [Streptomyces alkaliterrae]